MLTIRKSEDRGLSTFDWLKSHHTFSFADYFDKAHMNFGPLRVINEDFIAGGMGFGSHPHRDMEIITYVINGSLKHQDSMGNAAVIKAGEVQRMSAGTGVLHSEFNPDPKAQTHLLQIWIMPEHKGIKPGYAQKDFDKELATGHPVLVVSKEGRQGSLTMDQDADVYLSRLKNGGTHFDIRPGRGIWIQVIKGDVSVLGKDLKHGDAAAITDEKGIDIKGSVDAEVLVFDLPL